MINVFATAEKWCGCTLLDTRKKINELKRWTDKRVVFRKQGTEIKRSLYSPQLGNSNNLHWLAKVKKFKFYSTFVRLETFENEYRSSHWRKRRTFFLGLNLHEFPLYTKIVRRKEPQGSSLVIHIFNKHSIVKLFI